MAKKNPRLKGLARHMRKKPTGSEDWLWRCLQGRRFEGVKFRRQVPLGRYIADFASHDPKLVVELDGKGHERTVEYDLNRKAWLQSEGFTVLRFGSEIPYSEGSDILDAIAITVESLRIHPKPAVPDGKDERR